MRFRGLVVLAMAGGAVLSAGAKNKKDAQIPQLFCQAQYVWVQTVNGDPLNPNVVPEDRTAANALIAQLQGWKRYVVVKDPQQADLVWVVRTGRAATLGGGNHGGGPGAANQDPSGMDSNPSGMGSGGPGGGGMGRGGPGGLSGPGGMSPGNEIGASGNNGQSAGNSTVGSPDDILAIYQRPNGEPLSSPLWQKTERNGLEGKMPLFDQIRGAVDASCVSQPATPAQ
jgi:hypothetical protein